MNPADRGETGEIGNQAYAFGSNALLWEVIPLRPGGGREHAGLPEIFQVHKIMRVGDQRDVELLRRRTGQVRGAPQRCLHDVRGKFLDQPENFPGRQQVPGPQRPHRLTLEVVPRLKALCCIRADVGNGENLVTAARQTISQIDKKTFRPAEPLGEHNHADLHLVPVRAL